MHMALQHYPSGSASQTISSFGRVASARAACSTCGTTRNGRSTSFPDHWLATNAALGVCPGCRKLLVGQRRDARRSLAA